MTIWIILALVLGAGSGVGATFFYNKKKATGGQTQANELVKKAKNEASDIVLAAKNEAIKIKDDNKKEEDERRREWKKNEDRLIEREGTLDKKLEQLDTRAEKLRAEENNLDGLKNEIKDVRVRAMDKLEKIAGLSRDEAKSKLMTMTEREIKEDLLGLVKKEQEDLKDNVDDTAQALILTAMERMGSEVVADRTVSGVKMPEDDSIKGRIIGKEGRNIQTLQKMLGVDIMVDETPGMIVVSSFDPVRRAIAVETLAMLVKDGRINQASIEDAVAKAEKKINKEISIAGDDAAREVGVVGLPRELVRLLGELKYRTSYGQNVLLHSVEMAHIAGMIASEIGADVRITKTATLLHDIGKAVSHKVEGRHAEIGAELAKKYSMDPRIVYAMEAHHEDVEPTTPEAVIVKIVDAISAARPGARNITAENFAERMRGLEDAAKSFAGVEKAFAIQAGREIRVMVEPKAIDDLSALKLARDIANKVESTMQYPGVIKVNVIRETRAIEYAK
ncbi:MAG: ribonuclease Y [Candidatus Nomurabacteria bacterium]|jgi:ribonuclease Y|nr:ribonuclease Y [Candidatus Nomurabacteria bacterium]